MRKRLGEQLWREHPADVDVVVPVPDSGAYAAMGYSREGELPFEMGLVRNHYIGRTFIEPSQNIRNFGLRIKLNPVRGILAGRRIALIDGARLASLLIRHNVAVRPHVTYELKHLDEGYFTDKRTDTEVRRA